MAARWHTCAGHSVAAAAMPLPLLLLRVEDSLAPGGRVKLGPAHPGSKRQSSTTTSTTTAAMVPVAAAAAVLAKAETAAAAAASCGGEGGGGGGGGRSAHTLTHPRGGRLALLVVRAFREGFPSAPPTAARRELSNLSIFPSSSSLARATRPVSATRPLFAARGRRRRRCANETSGSAGLYDLRRRLNNHRIRHLAPSLRHQAVPSSFRRVKGFGSALISNRVLP